jgi:hypothetical protein
MKVDVTPLERIVGRLVMLRLSDVDFTPLMMEWRTILEEDNREARLAGQDGWGIPLIPVTYRPDPSGKPANHTILANNNLTSSWYRELTGPPMAPRGVESRTITNFVTSHLHLGSQWQALGAWEDVFSPTGYPFLGAHFRGEGWLPVRNLAHVRPTAMARVRDVLSRFGRWLITHER